MANETLFRQRSPISYVVDSVNRLTLDTATGRWKGGFSGQQTVERFEEAAIVVATNTVAGLKVRLLDTNGDRITDTIDGNYHVGVQMQDNVWPPDVSV